MNLDSSSVPGAVVILADGPSNPLELETQELGAEVLFLLKEAVKADAFLPSSLIRQLATSPKLRVPWLRHLASIEDALYKAFSWLERESLIIPVFDSQRDLDYRRLSLLAMRFRNREDLARYLGPPTALPRRPYAEIRVAD